MNAWIFDVDGVIVRSHTWEIENKLIGKITQKLISHEPVVFISGRSVEFQDDAIVSLIKKSLEKQAASSAFLSNLYLSGEFGGTSLTYTNGEPKENINQEFGIPEGMIDDLTLATKPFLKYFVIEKKKTIFTVYFRNSGQFKAKKDTLMSLYRKIVEKYHLTKQIELHSDSSAINVKYKKATKDFATKEVLAWLGEKNLTSEYFYVFGDSASDLAMGEELFANQLPFTFVYVGNPDTISGRKEPFLPIFPTQKEDKGTLEALQKLA